MIKIKTGLYWVQQPASRQLDQAGHRKGSYKINPMLLLNIARAPRTNLKLAFWVPGDLQVGDN